MIEIKVFYLYYKSLENKTSKQKKSILKGNMVKWVVEFISIVFDRQTWIRKSKGEKWVKNQIYRIDHELSNHHIFTSNSISIKNWLG